MYNVVTNSEVIKEIKKCRYFKTNLGIVSTVDKSGDRVLNDKDKFSYFYNSQYKTTIYMQGNIGDIVFYVDHYVKSNQMAFYYNTEEFLFELDKPMIKEKGVEFFLGHIIKNLETQHQDRITEAKNKQIETKREADPSLIQKSPGSVSYEDIKAYLDQKNKNRYSV